MFKPAFKTTLLAVGIMLFSLWGQGSSLASHNRQEPSVAPPREAAHPGISGAIVQVVRKNIPSVVHIEVTESQEVANPLLSLPDNPLLRQFFDIPEEMPEKIEREVKGIGSGMIIDSTGHILTSQHVVGDASEIIVSLPDGSQYSAEIVGTDPPSDLAVIKISREEPFSHVTFGDSDRVEVGEWVVAIGQPEGLEQTVTQGIISAKHRTGVTSPTSYQDFLQTDAAINPGNSGGPLLNMEGHVIGVNTAILSKTGGSMGIGFAVPSNMAVRVSRELIVSGKVIRGWLGVSVQDLTSDKSITSDLEAARGAIVSAILRDSPAGMAGIEKGDIILAYQNTKISDSGSLRNAVAGTPPGSEAAITLRRNAQERKMTVKIGKLEAEKETILSSVEEGLGVRVRQLTKDDARKFNLASEQGVVLEKIEPESALGKEGLEEGDFILAINDQPATGVDEFASMLMTIPAGQPVILYILDHRTGQTGLMKMEMPPINHYL